MKKKTIALLAAMLALSIGMTSALAADENRGRNAADAGNGAGCGAAFADADGDGICDNCPNGGVCPQDGTGRRAGRRCGGNR